ncbi:GMC oxidoreductase [Mesorhizobium escarrei]|uniref:Cholesterol oxidase n=1 Tax=Mesorhizobium escarrei TaxID=666018 RepID=A0ABM9E9D6_9HYPH|nr:GMC family oxidoreductase [Mesorhizobium escarrei]CAH2405782.1 Cholesterol oxidase [Mesorhizobium escarrei]
MASFDYDVLIIGSGFGGSVAALRAAEKGYRVGVMEAGRRWKDEDIPKTSWDQKHYAWFPAAELYGIQRIEYLDDVLVLCGAGVGGGSHVYGNTLYVPPKQFFDAPGWAGITDWADELAPCYDQARRMFGVVRYPYLPTDVDRYMHEVAIEMGKGETFNKAPVGVYFGSPGVEAEDPYFGGVGPRRTGCISCGNCQIGCGRNAKNKLTTNYLYLAEKLGVEVHELHEVYDLLPLPGGGFEVHARHPGWAQRAVHLHRHTYTAEQVIVAAHAYGSSKLLHHMQHKGRLRGLSSELGKRARTNSEQLLEITRTHGQWKRDPEKIHITPGSVAITCGVWPDPVTSIEPVYYGVGSNAMALLFTYHLHGEQKHPFASWLRQLIEHPTDVLSFDDARHWSERSAIMLCMQTTDTSLDLYWQNGLLRSRRGSGKPPSVHIPVVEEFSERLAKKMGSREGALRFEVINRTATAHFTGGIPIGDSSKSGAVDPYQRMFGQPGLHVMDGSVMAANPGVNPSLTIAALAERAMSLWPNKGEPDPRPPLGGGYERIDPVMPHRPCVPAGAPGELRLDAKKSDIIPEYPY